MRDANDTNFSCTPYGTFMGVQMHQVAHDGRVVYLGSKSNQDGSQAVVVTFWRSINGDQWHGKVEFLDTGDQVDAKLDDADQTLLDCCTLLKYRVRDYIQVMQRLDSLVA
jgi:hypothetical protein